MEDPLGEVQLNMSKLLEDQRNANIWAEIKAAHERHQPVMVGHLTNPQYQLFLRGACRFPDGVQVGLNAEASPQASVTASSGRSSIHKNE
eukprot:6313775-Pyramimonas_sp.AAC.2